MLTALNQKHQKVLAQHALKAECYYCPICKEKVILRQGQHKIAHFAHQKDCTSHFKYQSESFEHLQYKMHLYQQFLKQGYSVRVEEWIPYIQQVPDIIVGQTAIEVQLSSISPNQLQNRTNGLIKAGYDVIWLTRLPVTNKGLFQLSQLHQTCINISKRELLCIEPSTLDLIRLTHLIPITSKQFYAQKEVMTVVQCVNMTSPSYENHCPVRKLSTSRILSYLAQCRRKNSVLEPTLSLAYRLQLSDTQICKLTGYLFPEQLYFHTHPVLWQLTILYCLQCKVPANESLKELMKIRSFYHFNIQIEEIIQVIIRKYCKFLKI
ncbi:competence protein CoiA [Staphylococcus felis]|uniref:Competence protein CoiA n=1 Tax=Staphylococcus felis TaxID=46127 RepID=A0ABS0QQK8_9STAP|nr:competence protein CoiA family protein [Staphylococcus felis]MBH9581534.1 competence protein CoiA [Staphylococcus felis]MDM8327377.1 competence protein CoiA family protein [Staphylococcus felis]MDQ7193577.1 competence protein CoiA family protein [Staphylococcus felis]REH92148.1 competence protein CoiA [Staphylococcus felis]